MSTYKVTPDILSQYNKYIDEGMSKAAACRNLNIATTTMSDHIKRLAKIAKHAYTIMRRPGITSIIVNDTFYNIKNDDSSDKQLKLVIALITREDFQLTDAELSVLAASEMSKDAAQLIESSSLLTIRKGICYYRNNSVTNDLYNVLKKVSKTSNITKFADRLLKNPDSNIIANLYGFICHNDITIDKNGYIIAYKAVNNDFKDFYTCTFDNSVGNIVAEDRKLMDASSATCAKGLHIGSQSYISKIYGHNFTLIKCRVDPQDFVAIPADYSFAKARVCRYKVLEVVKKS